MINTFIWVLRFAFLEFLAGIIGLAGGVYLAFNLPAAGPNVTFVPVVAMFGIWPYVVMAVIGAFLLVHAWRKGAAWKMGK